MSGVGRYREKRTKKIDVPSGFVFTIRKPGRESYMKLLDAQDMRDALPDFKAKTENIDPATGQIVNLDEQSQKLLKRMMDLMDEVLVKCIVEPKTALVETDDALGVDEIDLPDYFVLVKEVFEFADLSEQKMKSLFPVKPEQPGVTGGESSDGSQPEAKPDIETGKSPG